MDNSTGAKLSTDFERRGYQNISKINTEKSLDLKGRRTLEVEKYIRSKIRDDNFYSSDQITEDCPSCYEKLLPENFTINCKYCVMETKCTRCHLNIFLYPNIGNKCITSNTDKS